MARKLAPEDVRLWSQVAATVRPAPGKVAPKAPPASEAGALPPRLPAVQRAQSAPAPRKVSPPQPIEPNRERRLARGLSPIGAVLDLHGFDQVRAETAVRGFVLRAHDQGHRAVLIITGRGLAGGGVLRRATPEWLAAPDLRAVVAGISQSHQKHGGEGALYVALKRKTQP